jgi:hypothetical protein
MLLRPFGVDVQDSRDGDLMPPAAKCVQDTSKAFLLSSSGQKWLPMRTSLTRSKLCMSKSRDKSLAAHNIALHEIVRISPGESLPLGEIVYESDSSLEEDAAERTRLGSSAAADVKRETAGQGIIEIETDKNGFNFGRVFILNLGSGTEAAGWLKDLEILRVEESHAFNRRTLINRKQETIRQFYDSKRVQYAVALMIISNFLLEAVNTEVHWEEGGTEAMHITNIDR